MHNLFLHSADIGIMALFQVLLGICSDPISFEPVSTTALNYKRNLYYRHRSKTCTCFAVAGVAAEMVTGCSIGKVVYIPRNNSNPTDRTLPFKFRRRQFPLRLAFAKTIKKAQGQTLRLAGLYLPTHPFSHGQLYVAKTRVGAKYVLCERSSSVARSKTKKESMSRTLFIRSCCV